ncbi:MAG: thymidine phosphorylase [Spirochaetes bacterium]|nr:thymidine phosphorylase [Spirochaetota bacterium]
MRAVDIIRKKRDGGELNAEEIRFLIRGCLDGSVPDYQVAAWLMAVYFRGMSDQEMGDLTKEMIESGDRIDLSGIPGPFVDKHSTGGVGDKVSLILAPLVACFGIKVPMMSGRSLGHTGGTLDKLEAIPGYRIARDPEEFRRVLLQTGYAMTGQSERIVPADRVLYALRDVTATVESIPLITASILSKKFAEGAESLVFDVKCGDGAFMKTLADAEELAKSLARTGKKLGRKIVAVITDMNEPLGRMVGNFLEAEESALCLRGETRGREDLMEVTLRLSAWMLVAGGMAKTPEEGMERCQKMMESGKPYQRFLANIEAQGGDPKAFEQGIGTLRAPIRRTLKASKDGRIQRIEAYKTGLATVVLGAGRNKTTDSVYPYVGIHFFRKKGESVQEGEPILELYGETDPSANEALSILRQAVHIASNSEETSPLHPRSLVLKEIVAL